MEKPLFESGNHKQSSSHSLSYLTKLTIYHYSYTGSELVHDHNPQFLSQVNISCYNKNKEMKNERAGVDTE